MLHSHLPSLCILALLLTCPIACSAQDDESVHPGWIELFDGKTLAGWHGDNPHVTAKAEASERDEAVLAQQPEFEAHWRAENGVLINDGKGPYATTDEEFGDVEFWLEYKTVAKADSGIYLRGTPQVQIWDTTEAGGKWNRGANFGSGGLFNNRKGMPGQFPLRLADRPFGEWNTVRMVQIGSRTWVELNHQLVVDGAIMENYWDKTRQTPLPARGPIHLQTHGGEIQWRHLSLRPIDSDEAISRLRGADAKYGFEPIFNGSDLAGWAGAVEDYEVEEGVLRCKPGKGGVLFTERAYENFAVRLEFKLPPGGNNGLAIRYPGQGRAAYDGMCELQVLDDEADKYAQLDPRQYHGSIYGIVPSHRGYLRPVGEWNFQEVTVEGTRIRVELNGTIIVDADVSKIHEYKSGDAHPGKLLSSGHFGFAGHNDPVEFRNIAIKELPPTEPAFSLEQELLFHSSFDSVADANASSGEGLLLAAESTKREEVVRDYSKAGIKIAAGTGVRGDALWFHPESEQIVFYSGNEVGYRESDWSGSISLWLKLDPDKDLAPGYCDPIQITTRAWNDGSFFVDFDKELPRDFRLGAFSDLEYWNPDKTPWEEIAPEDRPLIVVQDPPFASDTWTHVCFTWSNVNAPEDAPATVRLYLNGVLQGEMQRPIRMTWERKDIAMMLGLSYLGAMDELRCYSAELQPEQVEKLYHHELP